MAIKATFKDYYTLTEPSKEALSEFKDYYAAGGRKKLIIDMEATHAGLPLNNPRFYIPSRMEEGVNTIQIGKTPMKILKHHDVSSDPIGIAVDRMYVPTIPEDLVGNPDVLILSSKTASIKDQLKAMRNLKRAGILDKEDYRGLGYIRLKAEISHPDAVAALEDKRFDAISTNFDSPNEIYCSICSQNLAKDGWCEHERGEMYFADGLDNDGDMQFECQWIPGSHKYLEASLVVLKGDPLATIELVDTVDEDKNQTVYMSQDSVESGHSTFQFKDSVEEDDMKINGKEVILSDAEQLIFDSVKKAYKDMSDEDAYGLMKDVLSMTSSKEFIADSKDAEIDEEKAVLYAIHACYNKDSEVKAEEICDGIREELKAMKDEELLTEEEFNAAIAKISEDGLTKLPKSTFCGPDKTFPVPDSAHATAAKRFADKYEGPGDKVKILAAINIKAKAFGTDSKDDTDTNTDSGDVDVLKTGDIKAMDTEELRVLWHNVELELIDRKQVLVKPCSDCAVKEAETTAAKKELGEARDAAVKNESIISVLRGELRKAYSDYDAQIDAYVALGEKLFAEKVEKVSVIGVLTNKYDSIEKAKEELLNSDVDEKEKTIMDSFDIKEITSKLNDGISNDPNGETVDNPITSNVKDNDQLSDNGLTAASQKAISNIKHCVSIGDNKTAVQIFGTMKRLKMFPDNLTLESIISADTAAE